MLELSVRVISLCSLDQSLASSQKPVSTAGVKYPQLLTPSLWYDSSAFSNHMQCLWFYLAYLRKHWNPRIQFSPIDNANVFSEDQTNPNIGLVYP